MCIYYASLFVIECKNHSSMEIYLLVRSIITFFITWKHMISASHSNHVCFALSFLNFNMYLFYGIANCTRQKILLIFSVVSLEVGVVSISLLLFWKMLVKSNGEGCFLIVTKLVYSNYKTWVSFWGDTLCCEYF